MSEESRRIAEALGSDRDRRAREVRERSERRERIAERLLPVVVADYLRVSNEGGAYAEWKADAAAEVLDIAEEFMAESDSRRAAELEEARS